MKFAGAHGITRLRMPFFATLALVFAIGLAGCEGDDGKDGADGTIGADGLSCWDLNENGVKDVDTEDLNGDGVVDVNDCNGLIGQNDVMEAIASAKPESCGTCHSGYGAEHQDVYDKYTDDSNLTLTLTQLTSAPVGDPVTSYNATLTFSIQKNGAAYVDGVDSLGEKRFNIQGYDGDFPQALNTVINNSTITSAGNGNYTVDVTGLTFDPVNPTQTVGGDPVTGSMVYGYVADDLLVQHGSIKLYDGQSNAALAYGNIGEYESAADVAGCVNCHGDPYLKHGYRAAAVDGLSDFTACKNCHLDDRNGTHPDWQWMVDDPLTWATAVLAEENMPADVAAGYAYKRNIMNDVHMAHAMEFPYPMSMSNCATCHTGDKLDAVLDDANFVGATCKSCHAVEGTGTWGSGDWGDCDDTGEGSADTACYYENGRAPALRQLWTEAGSGVAGLHQGYNNTTLQTATGCAVQCHGQGAARSFRDYHPGYDKRMYDADGNKYADTYTASIDDVTVDGDTITVELSVSDPDMVPELLISFYGYDTKNFIVPSHARDGADHRYEVDLISGDTFDNPLFSSVEETAAGSWTVTADLAAWVPFEDKVEGSRDGSGQPGAITDLIADGVITKAEITVLPTLALEVGDDTVNTGLDAVTRTIDVATGAEVPNYFKGVSGAGATGIVDVAKCNNCHIQLAVTFHGNGAGGDIVACRNCHNPTFPGSHLERQSRSIESYVHAIHSFQAFDTDGTDLTDPVEIVRYEEHVGFVFPLFTTLACEGCHTENSGVYEVPNQSESLSGLLRASYDGNVPEKAVGPASKACGSCHRAEWLKVGDTGSVAAFDSHTESFGTFSTNDSDDEVLFGIIDKIMSMFQ